MSDTPQGGWWKAKDGKWYPPETHPDHGAATGDQAQAGPPAAGWWQANDGNWYPPETHPDYGSPTIDLTESNVHAAPAEQAEDVSGRDDAGVWNLTPSAEAAAGAAAVGADDRFWDLGAGPAVDTADAPSDAGAAADVTAGAGIEDEVGDAPVADAPVEHTTEVLPPFAPTPVVSPLPEPEVVSEAEVAPVDEPAAFAPPPSTPAMPPFESRPPLFSSPMPPNGNGNGAGPSEHDAAAWAPPADLPSPTVPGPPSTDEPGATPYYETPPLDLTPLDEPELAPEPLADDPDAPLPGWRKGADGAWYPPNQEVPSKPQAFPSRPPEGSPFPTATAPAPGGATRATTGSRRRRIPVPLIAALVGVLVLGAIVVAVLALTGGDDDPSEVAEQGTATTASTAAPSTTVESTTTVTLPPPTQLAGTSTAQLPVGSEVTDPYLALVTHDGPGSFSAAVLSVAGVSQELVPQGTSGPYLGVVPVNFGEGQSFESISVVADGPWAVTFAVVQSAPVSAADPGSSYAGSGDEVLAFDAVVSTPVRVTCDTCTGPIRVQAWRVGAQSAEELALVSGEALVPAGTEYLQVTAPGPGSPGPAWNLAVN